jgi:hypothetical protein
MNVSNIQSALEPNKQDTLTTIGTDILATISSLILIPIFILFLILYACKVTFGYALIVYAVLYIVYMIYILNYL